MVLTLEKGTGIFTQGDACDTLFYGHPDAEDALSSIREKVEQDESLCHRVVQRTGQQYPQYHARVWKYDCAPPSVKGAGRKSWRVVVFVRDLDSVPKGLVAIACYSKSDDAQLAVSELARHADLS